MSTPARPERASVRPSGRLPGRLSRRTVALYAVGSLGSGGYATLPGLVLTYFLTDNLGVSALVAGLIVTAAKIWDVVIDPVIGAASDRQFARTGSRRGFMAAGALSLPFFFAATFAVPPSWGPAAGAVCVLLAFLATATAFSLFQVPYIALPAELTSDYDERTRLLGWRVVVLTAAILLFGAGGPELRSAASDPVLGYLLMGAVAGIAIGLGMWVAARTADAAAEAPADHATPPAGLRAQYAAGLRVLRRSQPFRALLGTYLLQALATGTMLAAAQYVATWVLGSEDAVTLVFIALVGPALVATPAWAALARRIGKERAFGIASVPDRRRVPDTGRMVAGSLDLRLGRSRRRGVRGAAGPADGDAPRRDLTRRAGERSRTRAGRDVHGSVDRRRDGGIRARRLRRGADARRDRVRLDGRGSLDRAAGCRRRGHRAELQRASRRAHGREPRHTAAIPSASIRHRRRTARISWDPVRRSRR